MKCQTCGRDYFGSSATCSYCGQQAQRRNRHSQSRLIEFPRKARVVEEPRPQIPAWRVELNEKLREIKARRNRLATPTSESYYSTAIEPSDSGAEVAADAPPTHQIRRPASRGTIDSLEGELTPSVQKPNSITEAALERAERAKQVASRAMLQDSPRSTTAARHAPALHVDREATARALDPVPDTQPLTEPELDHRSAAIPEPAVTQTHASSSYAETAVSLPVEEETVLVCDEIEPRDYLQAEIRRLNQQQNLGFRHDENASRTAQVVILLVDVVAIALSSAPFLAMIIYARGDLSQRQTLVVTGMLAGLIAIYYLGLTQWLRSKTFGMMAMNCKVVDSGSLERPPAFKVVLRTIAFFFSLATVVGALWPIFSTSRRGWIDYLSGTRVVRDF